MSSAVPSGKTVIAVDAMGGDHGPSVVIPALEMVLKGRTYLHFLVFGDEEKIKPHLAKHKALQGYVTVRHTDKMIKSEDKPSSALRASKGTSMRMAIEAVESGEAKAVVSAGNTGALMALAKLVLRPLADVHRPAIASVWPGINGDTVMLDLGANVLVDAENLVQFAVLGAVFAKDFKKLDRKPTVGLLNIGSEDTKGPDHVRGAAAILSRINFCGTYHGFVEGEDITHGTVDVIVCDGYAGNIALKTAEGVGKFVKHSFTKAFTADPLAMLGAMLSYYSIRKFKKRMDPRLYNGGVFLGLNGLCIKSHGGADALGFSSALVLAVRLAREDYTHQITEEITQLMAQDMLLTESV